MIKLNEKGLLLAIETFTKHGSFALFSGSKLLMSWIGPGEVPLSVDLIVLIENRLNKLNIDICEIEFLVHFNEAGSSTGFRIGMSFLKALQMVTNANLSGADLLKVFVYNVDYEGIIFAFYKHSNNHFIGQKFLKEGNSISQVEDTFVYNKLQLEEKINGSFFNVTFEKDFLTNLHATVLKGNLAFYLGNFILNNNYGITDK